MCDLLDAQGWTENHGYSNSSFTVVVLLASRRLLKAFEAALKILRAAVSAAERPDMYKTYLKFPTAHTHSNWTKIVKISDLLAFQGVWRNVQTVIRVEFEVKLKMENDQVKSWVRPSLLLHVKVRWGMKSAGWDIKTMWISGRISLSFPRALLSTSRRSEAKSVSSLYYVSLFLT